MRKDVGQLFKIIENTLKNVLNFDSNHSKKLNIDPTKVEGVTNVHRLKQGKGLVKLSSKSIVSNIETTALENIKFLAKLLLLLQIQIISLLSGFTKCNKKDKIPK